MNVPTLTGVKGFYIVLAGFLSPWLAAIPAAADNLRVPLIVNQVGDQDLTRPLQGGVPFARGEILDAGKIRLVDGRGNEIPAQIDVTARYSDRSIRWVLVSFVGKASERYYIDVGTAEREAFVPGVTLQIREDGGQTIDTGSAVFELSPNGLMIDTISLQTEDGPVSVLQGGGDGAWLVDNHGRRARVAGPQAAIETQILKQGPRHLSLRREGWYVTDRGERLARGVVRMQFFADASEVKITHTLIFSEDTNKVWLQDYGLFFPLDNSSPAQAFFDLSRDSQPEAQFEYSLKAGESLAILQETFPHFLSEDSRFILSKRKQSGAAKRLLEGAVAGDWCALITDHFGLAVVLPDLAEQFPKEMDVRTDGIRLHLWAGNAGRALDFRAENLIENYWGEWAQNPARVESEDLLLESNAQGSAKTHELWLLPLQPNGLSGEELARQATPFTRPALVHPDPAWTTYTEAIGWPIHPYDPDAFPAEEAMIRNVWDRTLFPNTVFPMTGFINWGAQPAHSYAEIEERWIPRFVRLAHMTDYGLRERAWTLFARSGDRDYADFGWRFNRFAHDWNMHHLDTGSKVRGGFASGRLNTPFYWGSGSFMLSSGNSGHTLNHFLFDYYMTGNEVSREAVAAFGEAVKASWDPSMPLPHPGQALRVLAQLYNFSLDPEFLIMARTLAHDRIIDLNSPNGINPGIAGGRALYKVHRLGMALYEYYQASGDPAAREAFLKLVDHEYRFNRFSRSVSGQEFGGILLPLAFRMTGDPAYHRGAAGMLETGLVMEPLSLEEAIEERGINLSSHPYTHLQVHTNIHPLLGMPATMALLAEWGEAPGPQAWVVKSGLERSELILLPDASMANNPSLRMAVRTPLDMAPEPQLFGPDGTAIPGIQIESEELILSYNRGETGVPGERQFSLRILLPPLQPNSTYHLVFDERVEFTVLENDTGTLALFVPEGFRGGLHRQATDLLPFYFYVPDDLQSLKLHASNPEFWLYSPDGSTVIRPTDGKSGALAVPVEGQGGFWSLQAIYPVHWKLLNTPPIVAQTPYLALDPHEREHLANIAEAWRTEHESMDSMDTFVPGPQAGQALHLAEGMSLRFPRGETAADTGYEFFPAESGTLEFWFRPNWSSTGQTHPPYEMTSRAFFSSGSIDLMLRLGVGRNSQVHFSHLHPSLRGERGVNIRSRDRHLYRSHWFRQGEWAHIAMTWNLRQDKRQPVLTTAVFVNGVLLGEPEVTRAPKDFQLSSADAWIELGPELDGSIADLRLSDTVRYSGSFHPPSRLDAADEHTRVLFTFDGHLSGLGRDGQSITATLNP